MTPKKYYIEHRPCEENIAGGSFKRFRQENDIDFFIFFAEISRIILKNSAQVICGLRFVVNGRRIYSYIEIPKTVHVLCSVENYIPLSSVDANYILFNLVLYVVFITGWNR